jgi:hypothetical protein
LKIEYILEGGTMPDDTLFDAVSMTDARTALICARLNLRGGKRRLRRGHTVSGIAALYDSVLFGMRYYIARHKRCASFLENIDPWDAMSLFHALRRAGVFDDPLVFNHFSWLVERVCWQQSFSFDVDDTLAEVEKILVKLGVMPPNEFRLPHESTALY